MTAEIATSRQLQYAHEVRYHKQQGAVGLRETITCHAYPMTAEETQSFTLPTGTSGVRCRAYPMTAEETQSALQENDKPHTYYVVRRVLFDVNKRHYPLNTPTQLVIYDVLITFVRPFTPLPRRSKSKPVRTALSLQLRCNLHPYVHVLDNRTGRLSRGARRRLRELVVFDELAALLEDPPGEKTY